MTVRRSTIGWTDYSSGDANFIIGCSPCSEGCRNCYARNFSEVRIYPEKLKRLAKIKFVEGDYLSLRFELAEQDSVMMVNG